MATPTLVRPTTRLSHRAGFWVGLAATFAMLVGAAAPSPFYPVLQAELGYSQATSTIVFAIYAVALLVTLLITGSLSDHVGRRPVLSIGFFVLALSMLLFWHADTVTVLLAARTVQGLATGLLLSTLAAVVVDFESPDRPHSAATLNSSFPLAGLAAGALAGGVAIELLSSPLAVIFGALVVLYVVFGAVVWTLPETSARHEGVMASLVPRIGLPRTARSAFNRSAPAVFAGWATGGFYLSLGAPLVQQTFDEPSPVLQGLVVTALTGSGALSVYLARSFTPRHITLYGTVALAVGTGLGMIAISQESLIGFLATAVVAGSGFGTTFMGIMRSITPTVGPEERGELFSTVFVISYLAFGIPAVAAGFASPILGIGTTATVYGAVVVALSVTAALLRRFTTRD
ncbi:MFS transporter [Aeromicrobium sp. CF3.5]|uniref:MFS transporter n=1 Tax=Aeromicrobium sp. CF3.5 TaxID=3373078 RepID=UPI003EE5C2A0